MEPTKVQVQNTPIEYNGKSNYAVNLDKDSAGFLKVYRNDSETRFEIKNPDHSLITLLKDEKWQDTSRKISGVDELKDFAETIKVSNEKFKGQVFKPAEDRPNMREERDKILNKATAPREYEAIPAREQELKKITDDISAALKDEMDKDLFEIALKKRQTHDPANSKEQQITQEELDGLQKIAKYIGANLSTQNVTGSNDSLTLEIKGQQYNYNVEFLDDKVALKNEPQK